MKYSIIRNVTFGWIPVLNNECVNKENVTLPGYCTDRALKK